MNSKPLVIAHRGASAYRPENTPSAYALAIEQRADMIEIDLHRTRDGVLVVAHDAELEGLGGEGEIAGSSLTELRALDAGDGQAVPTLDEVLDRFGSAIPFNLEIKRGVDAEYAELEQLAIDAVRERGLLAGTLFSSFYDPVLARLRARAPQARIALLISRRYPVDILARARAVDAEAVNPEAPLVTRELVDEIHAAGLAVYPFTVDAPERMRELLDWGVDGLFTNQPDRMRAMLG